jgi:hypothetical protein
MLTVGFSISKHYSNGELFSFSFFGHPKSCCSVPCDCCHEVTDHYQLQADYTAGLQQDTPQAKQIDIFTTPISFIIPAIADVYREHSPLEYCEIPPPKLKAPLADFQSYLL